MNCYAEMKVLWLKDVSSFVECALQILGAMFGSMVCDIYDKRTGALGGLSDVFWKTNGFTNLGRHSAKFQSIPHFCSQSPTTGEPYEKYPGID